MGASALALCANPALWHTPSYVLGVLHNEAARQAIGLWAPLSLHSWLDVAFGLAALALLAGALRARPRVWELVALAGLALLTLHAARGGVWLALYAAPLAATGFGGHGRRERIPRLARPVALALLAAVLIGLVHGPLPSGAGAPLVDAHARARARHAGAGRGPAAEQVADAGGRVWVANPIDAFRESDQRVYVEWLRGLPAGDAALAHAPRAVLVRRDSKAERRLRTDARLPPRRLGSARGALRARRGGTQSPRGDVPMGGVMNAHAQPIRGRHSLARLARALDRAIPSPLLAIPPLWLALGLLSLAPLRIRADTWFDLAAGRDIVQHGLPHSDRLMALTAGHPWQDQQWLAHLRLTASSTSGACRSSRFVDAGCLVLALSVAILAARSFGGSPLWIAAVASPLILIQVPSETRAQSFAMPLFAALVWLLSRDARSPDRGSCSSCRCSRSVGEPARQHPDRLHARAAALRCRCGNGAARAQAARPVALPRTRALRCWRRSPRPTAGHARLLPLDGQQRRVPQRRRGVGRHRPPQLVRARVLPARRARDRRHRPARDPARAVRLPVSRPARADRHRHAPQRRLAALCRRHPAAGRSGALVARVGQLAAATVAQASVVAGAIDTPARLAGDDAG